MPHTNILPPLQVTANSSPPFCCKVGCIKDNKRKKYGKNTFRHVCCCNCTLLMQVRLILSALTPALAKPQANYCLHGKEANLAGHQKRHRTAEVSLEACWQKSKKRKMNQSASGCTKVKQSKSAEHKYVGRVAVDQRSGRLPSE